MVPPESLAEGIAFPQRLVAYLPGLDTAQYARLRGLRARMWTAYVREFTEINTWIVGVEEGYDFYACDSLQLPLEVAIPFIDDTLWDLKQAI